MTGAPIPDIHATLPALKAVVGDLAGREGITATYHLGGLVGYAPCRTTRSPDLPHESAEYLRAGGPVPGREKGEGRCSTLR